MRFFVEYACTHFTSAAPLGNGHYEYTETAANVYVTFRTLLWVV